MGRDWLIDISIHALLAESDAEYLQYLSVSAGISIHALLAESDRQSVRRSHPAAQISIHALLAESDFLPYNKLFSF